MPAPLKIALLIAFAATTAAPAFADPVTDNTPPAATASTTNAQGSGDQANKLICRSVEQLGSRLKKNRVCMTRSEWAEQRRQDRMNIDRSQLNRGTQGY